MFDKHFEPENWDADKIEKAYEYLTEYCAENKTTVKKLLSDKDNIAPAAAYIHSKLPFAARMVLKKDKIEGLIVKHYDKIVEQANLMAKKPAAKKVAVKTDEKVSTKKTK